jgi:hypothetical protein
MATYKLTPQIGHPVTGFKNSVIGWQFSFSGNKIQDFIEGVRTIQRAGWTWDIHPNPDNRKQQRIVITPTEERPNIVPILVTNNQWFAMDGNNIEVLDAQDVSENYTVERIELPPEPVVPEPVPPDVNAEPT